MTARRWTRDHDRLVKAWHKLDAIHQRMGWNLRTLGSWCGAKFGVYQVALLTSAQCRQASRGVNAWRHFTKGDR